MKTRKKRETIEREVESARSKRTKGRLDNSKLNTPFDTQFNKNKTLKMVWDRMHILYIYIYIYIYIYAAKSTEVFPPFFY